MKSEGLCLPLLFTHFQTGFGFLVLVMFCLARHLKSMRLSFSKK